MARDNRVPNRTQHRGMLRTGEVADAGIGPVDGKQVLRQVIRTQTEEVAFPGQLRGHGHR